VLNFKETEKIMTKNDSGSIKLTKNYLYFL